MVLKMIWKWIKVTCLNFVEISTNHGSTASKNASIVFGTTYKQQDLHWDLDRNGTSRIRKKMEEHYNDNQFLDFRPTRFRWKEHSRQCSFWIILHKLECADWDIDARSSAGSLGGKKSMKIIETSFFVVHNIATCWQHATIGSGHKLFQQIFALYWRPKKPLCGRSKKWTGREFKNAEE